jgi:hypothetical protein
MEPSKDDILTMKAADALIKLMNAPPIKKKTRKTMLKEMRAKNLKAWHKMQRTVKDREAAKYRNRSNAMKKAWAKRKMDTII